MPRVYLGVGSNINPIKNIELGLNLLTSQFGSLEISGLYQSKAAGFCGPDFLNAVVGFDTTLNLSVLAQQLRSIENDLNRTESSCKFSKG